MAFYYFGLKNNSWYFNCVIYCFFWQYLLILIIFSQRTNECSSVYCIVSPPDLNHFFKCTKSPVKPYKATIICYQNKLLYYTKTWENFLVFLVSCYITTTRWHNCGPPLKLFVSCLTYLRSDPKKIQIGFGQRGVF